MSKKDALKIVLVDVCCSNGKEFCEICPLKNNKNCEDIMYSETQLLNAVNVLVKQIQSLNGN